ncbi:MAG: hypothetical protein HYR66_05675 [Sphingobacteriales bacterium]|nr:hypothetical protein [Sphingobacteriales bacterium]MBI3719181.1 hypothetical protein [Sphingobacteriales bacterium]
MKRSNPKTKKESKPTIVEEDAALYKTQPKKKLTDKEKEILDNLSHSIEFVKKYSKGKTKAKSINRLLNEL